MSDISCYQCNKRKLILQRAGIDNAAIDFYIEWLHIEHDLLAKEDQLSTLLIRFAKQENIYAIKIYDHLKQSGTLINAVNLKNSL